MVQLLKNKKKYFKTFCFAKTGSFPGSYQQGRSFSRARSLEKRGSRPRSLESTGNPDSDGLNTRGKNRSNLMTNIVGAA